MLVFKNKCEAKKTFLLLKASLNSLRILILFYIRETAKVHARIDNSQISMNSDININGILITINALLRSRDEKTNKK